LLQASRMKWKANGRCMRQYVFGTHKLVAFSTLSHHFLQPLGIHIVTSHLQYNYYISTNKLLNVIISNIKHNLFSSKSSLVPSYLCVGIICLLLLLPCLYIWLHYGIFKREDLRIYRGLQAV
jgi:hypothetical protein